MTYALQTVSSVNSRSEHKIAVHCWGDSAAQPLLCVHGLTGNGLDFSDLAAHFTGKGFYVVAPDLPGRGQSDRLPEPMDYALPQYIRDMLAVIKRLNLRAPLDYLGTSLGGLIGIALTAMPETPVGRLILNDVGPVVPAEALRDISERILQPRVFPTLAALEQNLREVIRAEWGTLTGAQWAKWAQSTSMQNTDNSFSYVYDPAIKIPFEAALKKGGGDLWPAWKTISCPVLTIRGGRSRLLTDDIAEKMLNRKTGGKAQLVVFQDCGHAPSLATTDHIEVIDQWLGRTRT